MKKVTQTEFDNNFNEYDNSDESYENTRMNERSRSRQHQYGGSHNFNFSEIQNKYNNQQHKANETNQDFEKDKACILQCFFQELKMVK